jgi:tetratricopeptide (TPR) repeat protein
MWWMKVVGVLTLGASILVGLGGCGRAKDSPGVSPHDNSQARSADLSVDDPLPAVRDLIRRGRMQEAHEAIQQCLIRDATDPEALTLAAQTSHALGDIDRAVELLAEAARQWPENAANLRLRSAELLVEASRWNDSITCLRDLVRDDPDSDAARTQLARLLNARGYRFDANEQVRQLCRRSGAPPDLLQGLISPSRTFVTFANKPDIGDPQAIDRAGTLSVALALFGAGDVRDALTVLENSDLIATNDPCAWSLYGQFLIEAQQYDRFQDWLARRESFWERYPAHWMALGGWALHERKFKAAVRMFAEAVLREPGDEGANHRLTQALSADGQDGLAEQFRQRGKRINQLTQIMRTILNEESAGPQAVSELSARLAELGRPLESLAWHRLALTAAGAPQESFRQLAAEQEKFLKAEQQNPGYFRQALLSGLNLDNYPLDRSWIVMQREHPAEAMPSPSAGEPSTALTPCFVNVAPSLGIDFTYQNAPQPVRREFRIFQAYGAGIACLDYDCDGRVDFYVGQGAGEPPHRLGERPNQLLRNLGDRFQDVTEGSASDDRGYACGVTAGDWNQDGLPDLVVGNLQQNRLLINQGDGTFHTQAGDTVWNEPRYSTGLAIADVSGDHLPDIIEVNYLDDPRIFEPIQYKPDGTPVVLPGPLHFQPSSDRLFVSWGDGSMQGRTLGNATESAATGLGLLVTDLDRSIGNEIFVANDLMANHLWLRKVDGAELSFQNEAIVRGVAYGAGGMPMACMGIAAADFDENGRLDLHITNFADQWSNQYMQNDEGIFVDLVVPLGLDRDSLKMLGFGTQAIDYDNNSTVDLVVGNGHVEDFTAKGTAFEMPTQVFAWHRGRFQLMNVEGDPSYWERGHLSRALVRCDWNGDGRVDLLVGDLQQPLALLENRIETPYHWLQLELVGTTCERDAIGAVVRLTLAERTISATVQTGDGYMCKNESVLCFGLADHASVDSLEITWPDGQVQMIDGLEADHRWLVVQGEPVPFARKGK